MEMSDGERAVAKSLGNPPARHRYSRTNMAYLSAIKSARLTLSAKEPSAYSRKIDFAKLREIADEVGAVLMVDMAHFAGLVAGKVFQGNYDPVPFAHVVTTTTHKTLRGPRGGLILCTSEFTEAVDKGCPIILGGPLPHVLAAKAVALREASQPSFREYAHRIVENSQALAEACLSEGIDVLTGGTDNHLMLLDVHRSFGLTGRQAESAIRACNLTLNRNALPFDANGPWYTSGLRVGTPAATTLGMTPSDMKEIAAVFKLVARQPAKEARRRALDVGAGSMHARGGNRGDAVRAFAPGGIGNLGPGLDILGCAVTGPGDAVQASRTDHPGVHVIDSGHPDLPAEADRNAAALNQIIVPVSVSTPDANGDVIHEVQSGQSLWQIAITYGVKIDAIRQLNQLPTAYLINPGDKLLVKKVGTATPQPPTPIATLTAALQTTENPTSKPTLPPTATLTPTPAPPVAAFDPASAGWAVGAIIAVALVAAALVSWAGRARPV